MKQIGLRLFFLPALALGMYSLPATAGVLFSDLGPPGNVYGTGTGWTVSGSSSGTSPDSFDQASLFTVAGSGSIAVSQIDLGVTHVAGADTFFAAIYTDAAGAPDLNVINAQWQNLQTTTAFDNCCGLVTISGITGVTLTGGQSYFLLVGPELLADASWNTWMFNTQGVTGDQQYSTDGGSTWNDEGPSSTLAAFDILGDSTTPEPGSLLLLATGLAGILGIRRRRLNRQ